SILFRSADESVVLIDIPRSLEESQVAIGQRPTRRLRSGPPPLKPLPTPEPKNGETVSSLAFATQVAHLMTAEAARRALNLLAEYYTGPFCLDRVTASSSSSSSSDTKPGVDVLVPDGARYISGSLEETKHALLDQAPPSFDLIVLDPPWPNRSVRRHADSYATPRDLPAMRRLLLEVPVSDRLAPDGLVAVWITNKPAAHSLMTSPTGVLAAWGLELVAEWTWLKVAASGEPLYSLDSAWRKPWERLLVAKPRGGRVPRALTAAKVIAAVPDVHSRKPSLRMLFRDVLASDYVGLEVFARNLTSGWWSWGDEVVKFQQVDCWLQTS
ncbi:hypothetical protein CP533_2092, partial [Ophiocordyceps camponoti-saundersi (nom. inval.)]